MLSSWLALLVDVQRDPAMRSDVAKACSPACQMDCMIEFRICEYLPNLRTVIHIRLQVSILSA
jgi:hypothetical protein